MDAVFLKILNMSLTACWLIFAVLLARLLLKKAPATVRVALWALVGVRLCVPLSFESLLSLIPSAQPIPETITTDAAPAIDSGLPTVNAVVNPILSENFTPDPANSVNPLQLLATGAAILWVVGMAVLLGYAVFSFLRIKRQVRVRMPLGGNAYVCDSIASPFILGIFRPRIYLPSGLDEEATGHILAHERAHLRRRDHWWKPLGYFVLIVHWFNPLVWVAYAILCRDIELACDERVARALDNDGKCAYSRTLLDCGAHRRILTACPLAFGEVGVKTRVKAVLNYKKPAFWLTLVGLLAVAATAVFFLTNPIDDTPDDTSPATGLYRLTEPLAYAAALNPVDHDINWFVDGDNLYYEEQQQSNSFIGELKSLTLTSSNFDSRFPTVKTVTQDSFVWDATTDAATLRSENAYAWRASIDDGTRQYYYLLEQKDGSFITCYASGVDGTDYFNYVCRAEPVKGFCATVTNADSADDFALTVLPDEGSLPNIGDEPLRIETTEGHYLANPYSSPTVAVGDRIWVETGGAKIYTTGGELRFYPYTRYERLGGSQQVVSQADAVAAMTALLNQPENNGFVNANNLYASPSDISLMFVLYDGAGIGRTGDDITAAEQSAGIGTDDIPTWVFDYTDVDNLLREKLGIALDTLSQKNTRGCYQHSLGVFSIGHTDSERFTVAVDSVTADKNGLYTVKYHNADRADGRYYVVTLRKTANGYHFISNLALV